MSREIVIKAKHLLRTPDRWTKRAMARDGSGRIVSVNDRSAYCYCVSGAIQAASRFSDDPYQTQMAIENRVAEITKKHFPTEFRSILFLNDNVIKTHIDLMLILTETAESFDPLVS